MTDAISPAASVVTAYKAYANASDKSPPQQPRAGSDSFGPAVKPAPASLSAATLSAIDETSKGTTPSSYDRTGHPKSGA